MRALGPFAYFWAMQDTILIFDFGSQYTQLIARRIREMEVYCEIHPYSALETLGSGIWSDLSHLKGIVLSGSPCSVNDAHAPLPSLGHLPDVPLLGICYGAQLMARQAGGTVSASDHREYGAAALSVSDAAHPLFASTSPNSTVWMSHGDTITQLPEEYRVVASTSSVRVAAFSSANNRRVGLQFHPEVYHSQEGQTLLRNFVLNSCGANATWTAGSWIEQTIEDLRQKIGDDEVVMGLSGGVDSSVAAVLLSKAIGKRLHCLFIDNGLLRKNEFESVLNDYEGLGLQVRGVDAAQQFYDALEGISDPERKRKAIGKTFVDVFEHEARMLPRVAWLGQGTIYPDVIESVSVKGPSATIKSHHNVGGLPDYMKLKVVEPLRTLFKDEVRRVGKALGISGQLLGRHPFPGPGLGIRVLGEVTAHKIALLREADAIFINALREHGLYDQVWQAGAIFLPVQSVGVMGDERTYDHVVALRAVRSTDGMTADWCHLPYEFLAQVSTRIINQVRGINRVVYDISSKPPATIEWE